VRARGLKLGTTVCADGSGCRGWLKVHTPQVARRRPDLRFPVVAEREFTSSTQAFGCACARRYPDLGCSGKKRRVLVGCAGRLTCGKTLWPIRSTEHDGAGRLVPPIRLISGSFPAVEARRNSVS